MKTTTKQKLKKILLSGVITLTLVFSNFFGLTTGLMSMFAFADYAAEKYKAYDFETSSSWSITTSFQESSNNKPFSGTSSKFDLITTDTNDTMRPSTKYDGVSAYIESGATRDNKTGDYAMILKATDAPVTQNQVVKENNSIVYDKENFLTFDTQAEAEDEGKYVSLQTPGAKWLRLFDPESIAASDRDKYVELTDTEKSALDGTEYDGYLKLCLEKTEDVKIYYGYKSTSITINANTYYVASFWAYTSEDNSAEFVIKGTNFEAKQPIQTNGEWKYYSLFIAGKSDSSTSVNIYFYYGNSDNILASTAENPNGTSTGFSVLDDVVIQTINQTDFNQKTINGKTTTAEDLNEILSEAKVQDYAYTNADYISSQYSPRVEVKNIITNNQFQLKTEVNPGEYEPTELAISSNFRKNDGFIADTTTNKMWSAYIPKYTSDSSKTLLPTKKYNEYVAAYNDELIKQSIVSEAEAFKTGEDPNFVLAPSTFDASNYILKLQNTSTSLSLGYSTNAIKIEQLAYYRISVWLKATDENATATVKMHSEIELGTGPSQIITSQDITPYQKTSDATNNWMEVVFYVRGNAMHDYNTYLTILAGADSTIYVDNIIVEKISSSTYTSGTSSKKLDLAPTSSMPTTGISNGYFTSIKTTDDISTQAAPFEADSWTLDEDNTDSIVKGIIPTSESAWNLNKTIIGSVDNPNAATAKTNVYAIYAKDAESVFNMKSSSFSLTSGTVYKIFFSVYADNNVSNVTKLTVKLTLGTDEDTLLQISPNFTKGSWSTYSIYVRVDDSSRSLKLHIGFEDLQGTAFVKDIRHVTIADIKESDNKTIKTSDDEQFENALKANNANTYFLDFMSEQFAGMGPEITANGLYTSYNYQLEELKEEDTTKQGTVGIIYSNASYDTAANGTITDFTPNGNISNTVLIIENAEADMISNVNPQIVHSLSKSSYYKLTFKVRTSDFEEGTGLTIKINALSIALSNINTNDIVLTDEDNGYATYTVFVRTGSDAITSTYVGFNLTGKGYALIADINLEKLADKAAYETAIDGVEEDEQTFIKDYYVETETADTTTPEADDNNGTLAIFFYILSSLLLVGAIVVALIATFAKKHPIKKRVVGTNNADLVSYNKDGKPVSKRKAKNDADKGGFV